MVSRAALPEKELDEDDLKELFEGLYPVRRKYMPIGLQLDLSDTDLNTIKADNRDKSRECLYEILSQRLKKVPALTWHDIDRALRSDSVDEGLLAEKIRKRSFCKSKLNQELQQKEIHRPRKKCEASCKVLKTDGSRVHSAGKYTGQDQDSDKEVKGKGKRKHSTNWMTGKDKNSSKVESMYESDVHGEKESRLETVKEIISVKSSSSRGEIKQHSMTPMEEGDNQTSSESDNYVTCDSDNYETCSETSFLSCEAVQYRNTNEKESRAKFHSKTHKTEEVVSLFAQTVSFTSHVEEVYASPHKNRKVNIESDLEDSRDDENSARQRASNKIGKRKWNTSSPTSSSQEENENQFGFFKLRKSDEEGGSDTSSESENSLE